jgi:hypothetical protein
VAMGDESGVDIRREEDVMVPGILSHASSPSPSHRSQSPSPIRTRSRTRAMQRAASSAPLPPLQEEEEIQSMHPSSPLTILSDLGLSPEKSISGDTDKVMSQYINYDMTS